MKFIPLFIILFFTELLDAHSQTFSEILGRPGPTSVTMNILFDTAVNVYWEYGTSLGNYPQSTPTENAQKNTPLEVQFTGLLADKKYYYRTRYHISGGGGTFQASPEHNFHTARPKGSQFTFAIEADPHLDTNTIPGAYSLTLQNILAKNPDFMIDLGDNFMSEKLPQKNQANITARHVLYRPYFGSVCHSVPLYIVLGNHEGETGWQMTGGSGSLAVMASNTRKLYYSNPLPDGFYSGDSIPEQYVGLRGNYYSWEWGDALFIVLDPYWYTVTHSDWGWTLGEDQYNWFKKVITGSKAKLKFVFCHQLVGGHGTDGRGGSEFAGFFENGGENADSTWGFETKRPGWGKSVHQLMTENRGTIFFHGHDHCYAKQDKDGIVYQEVPQPGAKSITNFTGTQYGYVNGQLLPSRGYLLVTVTDSSAKVDYIRSFLTNEETGGHQNGEVAASYTILSAPSSVENKNSGEIGFLMNYPNPFSSETTIEYQVNSGGRTTLKIYDIFGREVSTLVDRMEQPGKYSVTFHPEKSSFPVGIYLCRIQYGMQSKVIKIFKTNE
ncbi:MAG: metallophosphoesterase [Bacteroidota bacterium]